MRLAKEGISFLVGVLLFFIISLLGVICSGWVFLKILVGVTIVLMIFSVYFFRDPERNIPVGENLIISPADGKVIQIDQVEEREFFNSKVKKVSIFMSVFNAHVNRIPISGIVTFFNYKPGSFHPAYQNEASIQNEQTTIGIENGSKKVMFRQIAGILARRIVCYVREGHEVKMGERFGMIKFGSRVDLFFTEDVEINVQLNQKVKAGETIIGEFKKL